MDAIKKRRSRIGNTGNIINRNEYNYEPTDHLFLKKFGKSKNIQYWQKQQQEHVVIQEKCTVCQNLLLV